MAANSIVPVLGQQIGALANGTSLKRGIYAPNGPGALDVFNPAKMIALGNNTRLALTNPAETLPVLPEAGDSVRAFARNFRTANRDTFTASQSENANEQVPYNRILFAPTRASHGLVDVPSQDEVVILKRTKMRDGPVYLDPSGAWSLSQSNYTLPSLGTFPKQRDVIAPPCIGVHPIALNYLLARDGLVAFNQPNDSAAYTQYKNLTPSDVWYGHPTRDLPEWCGWTMDGVARVEVLGTGGSSRDSNGWAVQPSTGNVMNRGGAAPMAKKVVTVIGAGQQEMLDVVASRGLMEGARIWWVFKKFPLGERGHRQQTYVRSHKSNDLAIESASNSAEQVIQQDDDAPRAASGEENFYRPWALAFYATADGDMPPPELREYTDEWGRKRYDGLIGAFCRVLFAPVRMRTFLPAPSPDQLAPLTNGVDLMQRDRFVAIIDADKDGLLANI